MHNQENPVAAVFNSYPTALRSRLLHLREMILDVAAATEGVGPVEETLKWGEPSYLTSQSRSGSTIRIAPYRKLADKYAMYLNCKTTLLETFRELYGDELNLQGKRAIVFDIKEDIPTEPLRHCIALALTYHLRSKSGGRAP